ncbi:hypothetical protein D0T51_08995 [Parabacteroides sp. 52]|uniref:penicillin-binding transpeptidase domain-containing protein n=1 Tax=unclassified Parabacteroides TaxID=2649774 RepID=UPI0013D21E6D|nr:MULTISPECIES: penicillin-binding transpeptidase domain-containing protein [unclassified Parabacteroides]MDH6535296.1 cell division protein FtsI (penicillin-binding protein 3) [Parabacteroides sp. PM5-20]NDV55859.1 hypothetical protein [Parabacteroides sp. 52]
MKNVYYLFTVCLLLSCTQSKHENRTREILSDKLTELQADFGLVVIMDNKGDIVSMVNLISDNGAYKEGSNEIFYTPRRIGTLFTPISMLIALNEISSTDIVDVGEGVLLLDQGTISDHNADRGGYGEITAKQVITFDSNVGIAKIISENYDSDKFIESIKNLGLDVEIGDIPLQWLACGYGVKISPISVLSFYSDIANNGSPEIKEMLQEVVKNGTGKPTESEVISIAGKSGTLNLEDKHEVSFCGYFPADNPKYTCLVIISNPKNGYPSGGLMAGSVFKEIANAISF